jgi:hypothetical protein
MEQLVGGKRIENDCFPRALKFEMILNCSSEKHLYAYPKVTMKTISSIVISCYSPKKWIERCKKKQLVKT